MAFPLPLEHKVVLVGDPEIGRSRLVAARMAGNPFLDNAPSYIRRPSFVQLITTIELEEPWCVPGLTSTTSTQKVFQNMRHTQLHVINVTDNAPFKR